MSIAIYKHLGCVKEGGLLMNRVHILYKNTMITGFISWLILQGTPCDLVTGEEQRRGNTEGPAAQHMACTVEMASVNVPCKSC